VLRFRDDSLIDLGGALPKIATWSPLALSEWTESKGPYVVLHLPVERQRKTWLGRCIELGTMAVGKTEDEARKSLIGLVTLQLNTLEQTGQRERVFCERGIVLQDAVPTELSSKPLDGREAKHVFEAVPAAA
jgi:hypothetical protein